MRLNLRTGKRTKRRGIHGQVSFGTCSDGLDERHTFLEPLINGP